MKILLIEDDEVLRHALSHLIPRWGYDIDTADCGQAALLKVQKFQFDIILLDEQLPDTKGRELASKLREHNTERQLLIIGLTGYVDVDARQSFLDAGMDDVIQKPLKRERLDEVVSELSVQQSNHRAG